MVSSVPGSCRSTQIECAKYLHSCPYQLKSSRPVVPGSNRPSPYHPISFEPKMSNYACWTRLKSYWNSRLCPDWVYPTCSSYQPRAIDSWSHRYQILLEAPGLARGLQCLPSPFAFSCKCRLHASRAGFWRYCKVWERRLWSNPGWCHFSEASTWQLSLPRSNGSIHLLWDLRQIPLLLTAAADLMGSHWSWFACSSMHGHQTGFLGQSWEGYSAATLYWFFDCVLGWSFDDFSGASRQLTILSCLLH